MTNTTLLIDKNGDIVLDAAGNFTFADGIDQVAQDCWLAVQTLTKDIWYNQQYGIPYFENILGGNPPESLIARYIQDTVGIVTNVAKVNVSGVVIDKDRTLHATINITSTDGQTVTLTI